MRSRQTVLEIFSTFLQFEAERVRHWATDGRLRRSMQACLNREPAAHDTEQFWAIYWHKRWQGTPTDTQVTSLSLGHLSAYLQETCYWSTQKVASRQEGTPSKLSDYFQVAMAQVPKILKAFDSNQDPSLKTYASYAFGNAIRDYLRQRREISYCNDWGLLLKLSRKKLVESLQSTGLSQATIERYRLAWACFETLYLPSKEPGLRQLPAPTAAQWTEIARAYNQQRPHLSDPGPEATAATIEQWMASCARHARAYLYPAMVSLNQSRGEQEREWLDDLPDQSRDSLLSEMVQEEDRQERQQLQQQLQSVLGEAIAKLDPNLQELLQLYYGQGLTQQQMGKQLGQPQYTVSRRLTKARETLLLALTRWSQETLHIAPTSTVVKSISAVLEEWLQTRWHDDPSRR